MCFLKPSTHGRRRCGLRGPEWPGGGPYEKSAIEIGWQWWWSPLEIFKDTTLQIMLNKWIERWWLITEIFTVYIIYLSKDTNTSNSVKQMDWEMMIAIDRLDWNTAMAHGHYPLGALAPLARSVRPSRLCQYRQRSVWCEPQRIDAVPRVCLGIDCYQTHRIHVCYIW